MSNWGICKSELGVYGWDFWEKLQEKINAKVIEIQKEDEIIHITVGKKRKEKTKSPKPQNPDKLVNNNFEK